MLLIPVAVPIIGALRVLVHAARRRPWPRGRVDALVVLGTAQYDGRPSRQLTARLEHALLLWRRGVVARVFTLGGNLPGDRFTEAGVAAAWLAKHGVPASVILEVPHGSDTRGSYHALLDAHDPGKVLIVTDPHHCLRAELLARGEGIDALASPTRTSPARFPSPVWWLTLSHEVGGLMVVDVAHTLGRPVADKVEESLRRLQGWLRPSRRARHEHLRQEQETSAEST